MGNKQQSETEDVPAQDMGDREGLRAELHLLTMLSIKHITMKQNSIFLEDEVGLLLLTYLF